MTRGNQRELARQKNLKKQKGNKERKDDMTPQQRREHDAAQLQAKIAAKNKWCYFEYNAV